ncbi:MAG: beta-lactamase [Promethearchaeota archaeon CR_4]|nr:MAG: beta-lactamase [Candidatus Lokiarchaeota archaeon CR_4]
MLQEFGPIKLLEGQRNSHFPACRSLFIDDAEKVIIDPGADAETLRYVNNTNTISRVFNTHYHFDHIRGNGLFPQAHILMNEIEADCFQDRRNIPRRVGVQEVYGEKGIEEWLFYIQQKDPPQTPFSPSRNPLWFSASSRLGGTYKDGEVFTFGKVEMEVINSPGHSEGHCCLLFPKQRVVYTTDIDLTAWGPYYGGSDSDIDLFITSAHALCFLDVDYYITGHEVGVIAKSEFQRRVDEYLAIIDQRDVKILRALQEPLTIDDLTRLGITYGGSHYVANDPWVFMWEKMSLVQNLGRLLKRGAIGFLDGHFFAVNVD